MPDTSNISHFPLKVIFAIHLVLITWSIQGYWCPMSVMFYNILFFVCLLWAVHEVQSDEPLQFALLINLLSIFLDIITLAVYFEPLGASERFGPAIMIINMVVRIITSVYLYRIGRARDGSLATMFSAGPAMGFGRRDYEDISQPIPRNTTDFDEI